MSVDLRETHLDCSVMLTGGSEEEIRHRELGCECSAR